MAWLATITVVCFYFFQIAESVRMDIEVHGTTVGPGFYRISEEGEGDSFFVKMKV